MISFHLQDLLEFVRRNYPDAQIQKETNQILFVLKLHELEFPVFLRLVEQGEILQIIGFFPLKLKAKTIPDIARVLHFINKEVDIPGFGIDEDSDVIFYRVMLPSVNKELNEELVEAYITSLKMLVDTFFPMIMAVNESFATFKDVMRKVNESKKAQQ